jgi:protein-disulfide isomerase
MSKLIGIATLLITICVGYQSCNSGQNKNILDTTLLSRESGTTVSLGKANTKYYAVIFFSPTCPVCRNVSGEIISLRTEFEDSILSVFVVLPPYCEKDTELLEIALNNSSKKIDTYIDVDLTLARKLQAKATPQIFLIDNTGQIVYSGQLNDYYRSLGNHGVEITRHYAAEALLNHMNSKVVTPAQTNPIGCLIQY